MRRTRPRPDDEVPQAVPFRVWAMGLAVAFGVAVGLRLALRGVSDSPLIDVGCWSLGALLGGSLTGTGRPHFVARALLFALTIGGAAAAFEHYGLHVPLDEFLAVHGAAVALSAMVGAGLGRMIWRPLPDLPLVVIGSSPPPMGEVTLSMPTSASRGFVLDVNWFQLAVGAAIAIGCTLMMERIQVFVVRAIGASGHTRSEFAAWALASITCFLGGVVAGMNRRRVLHQAVALWAAVAILTPVAVISAGRDKLVAYEFWLDGGLHWIGANPVFLGLFAGIAGGALAALGAWVGADMFPPLDKRPKRSPTDM